MILTAEDVNLIHFQPQRVSYEPKGIHTEAIQVNAENIGKLALEFEAELYDNDGEPYFCFDAERGTDDEPKTTRSYMVYEGNWIVVLKNELHLYKDRLFKNTFTFDNQNSYDSTMGLVITAAEAHILNPKLFPFPDPSPRLLDPEYRPLSESELDGLAQQALDLMEPDELEDFTQQALEPKPSPVPRPIAD